MEINGHVCRWIVLIFMHVADAFPSMLWFCFEHENNTTKVGENLSNYHAVNSVLDPFREKKSSLCCVENSLVFNHAGRSLSGWVISTLPGHPTCMYFANFKSIDWWRHVKKPQWMLFEDLHTLWTISFVCFRQEALHRLYLKPRLLGWFIG